VTLVVRLGYQLSIHPKGRHKVSTLMSEGAHPIVGFLAITDCNVASDSAAVMLCGYRDVVVRRDESGISARVDRSMSASSQEGLAIVGFLIHDSLAQNKISVHYKC
jgi:hypothetical protein